MFKSLIGKENSKLILWVQDGPTIELRQQNHKKLQVNISNGHSYKKKKS